jgi:glycosyltransferase 2 family protein
VKEKLIKIAKTALKLLLSAAALFYVFSKIEFNVVWETVKTANPYFIIAALLFFILSKIIAAFRLNVFFSAINISLTHSRNLSLYLLGMFYNLFLPGGVGGDGYKIFILSRSFGVKASKIFWAVVNDRLSGMVALFSIAMMLAVTINFPIDFHHETYSALLSVFSIAGFFLFLRIFFLHFAGKYLLLMGFSFPVQILQMVSAYFIITAIGEEQHIAAYMFLFLISSIVAMLPLTIGGAGMREITFLYGSLWLGLDERISVALSLIFYLITLFTSFWGVIFSFRMDFFGLGKDVKGELIVLPDTNDM